MTEFSLKAALDAYRPDDDGETEDKRLMLQLLHDHPEEGFKREWMVPGHFTASCWLIDADGTKALLTHHAFLNRWLQLGGHADGHADLLAAALREAHEESGLSGIEPVTLAIFDIDIHEIPANPAKNEVAHLHHDVRFLLKTTATDFVVSDESHNLGWFTADEMLSLDVDDNIRRMIAKWQNQASAGFAGKN